MQSTLHVVWYLMALQDIKHTLSEHSVSEVVSLIEGGEVEVYFHPLAFKCLTTKSEGTLLRLGVGPRIPVETNVALMRTRFEGID